LNPDFGPGEGEAGTGAAVPPSAGPEVFGEGEGEGEGGTPVFGEAPAAAAVSSASGPPPAESAAADLCFRGMTAKDLKLQTLNPEHVVIWFKGPRHTGFSETKITSRTYGWSWQFLEDRQPRDFNLSHWVIKLRARLQ